LEILGFMAILVFLWIISGAYKKADLNGVFIAPPPPVGTGGGYGPQIGTTSQYYYNDNANQ